MCAHLQGLRRRAAHLQLLYAGQPGCSHAGAAVAACSGSRPRLKPQPVQQVAWQQHHASPSRLPTNQHAGTMHHMHPSLAHAPPATDRDERRYSWGLEVSCQRLQPSWQAPLSPAACHQGRMGGLHQPLEGAGKAPGGGAAWRGLGGSGAAGRMIQHALNSWDEVDAGGGTHTGGASVHACPATPPSLFDSRAAAARAPARQTVCCRRRRTVPQEIQGGQSEERGRRLHRPGVGFPAAGGVPVAVHCCEGGPAR